MTPEATKALEIARNHGWCVFYQEERWIYLNLRHRNGTYTNIKIHTFFGWVQPLED